VSQFTDQEISNHASQTDIFNIPQTRITLEEKVNCSAFLIQKGRTIDPNGLNIREETYLLFPFGFFYYVLLSCYFILPYAYFQFTLSITFAYFRYYVNIGYIKTRTNVKSSIVPEEGWSGQPKYSTPSKNNSTLCRFLLLYSAFQML